MNLFAMIVERNLKNWSHFRQRMFRPASIVIVKMSNAKWGCLLSILRGAAGILTIAKNRPLLKRMGMVLPQKALKRAQVIVPPTHPQNLKVYLSPRIAEQRAQAQPKHLFLNNNQRRL